jgi:hypothetical protein
VRREDPHRFGKAEPTWPRISQHAAERYAERVRPDVSPRLARLHLEGLMARRRSACRLHSIADEDEVWELVDEPGVALVLSFAEPRGVVVTVLVARDRGRVAAEEEEGLMNIWEEVAFVHQYNFLYGGLYAEIIARRSGFASAEEMRKSKYAEWLGSKVRSS